MARKAHSRPISADGRRPRRKLSQFLENRKGSFYVLIGNPDFGRGAWPSPCIRAWQTAMWKAELMGKQDDAVIWLSRLRLLLPCCRKGCRGQFQFQFRFLPPASNQGKGTHCSHFAHPSRVLHFYLFHTSTTPHLCSCQDGISPLCSLLPTFYTLPLYSTLNYARS